MSELIRFHVKTDADARMTGLERGEYLVELRPEDGAPAVLRYRENSWSSWWAPLDEHLEDS